MSQAEILAGIIRPVLDHLAREHRVPGGPAAEAMLLAIGMQESRFQHRDQIVPGKPPGQIGPATGWWQFERGGGVRGVMTHPRTRPIALPLVQAAGLSWDEVAIWTAFTRPEGDELACAFARLLLYSDPRPLPAAVAEAEDDAWECYLRNWRPGRPHRGTWGGFWRQAVGLSAGEAEIQPAPAPAPAAGAALAALESRVTALEDVVARLRSALGA